jgi:hypothetical protein
LAERFIKRQQQQRICTQGADGLYALLLSIDERRYAIRRDDLSRMPVKRDHECEPFLLPGIVDGLPYDLLVSEMDAVKKTDG